MIWQRLALVLVAAGMLLSVFIAGRYRGDRSSVAAFRVEPPPSAWLQLDGDVRNRGTYPLCDIKMTNSVINMSVPLCAVGYDHEKLERLLKMGAGARLEIACSAGRTSGFAAIKPLSAAQGLVLYGSVPLNTATVEELCLVTGIGPVLAQRIVHYRQKNGNFEGIEDLLKVKGVAEKKLMMLRRQLTI